MGKIIDFIFPMIDKPSNDEIEEEQKRRNNIEKEILEYRFGDNEVDLMLKIADEYQQRENARLHEVESKATVFIGTFSVAVTILMGLLKEFMPVPSSVFLSTASPYYGIVMPFLLLIAIFYLCFAIINSVKTLQRQTFSVLGVKESLNAGVNAFVFIGTGKDRAGKSIMAQKDYKKADLARKKFLYTYRNEKVINRKVDYMTLAQAHFKRAVILLLVMISLILVYLIWYKAGDCITILRV